ncbi:MAG TPA: GvpL/GvpF family gas vesicle protein [Solirubrobacteraceae bacterium]|nr:GvpL/GvpF family gas vesicle protein [Solirubrobacteraceae bacterium]
MSVLVYAIAQRGDSAVGGHGFQHQPLRGIRSDALMAIVSDHEGAALRPEVETLWDYERIVERIAQAHAIVPVRFGSVMDDDEAVVEMLRSRREHLLTVLEYTRGAVELAVRATWEQAPEPEHQTGTGYMRARLQLRSRAREVAGDLMPLGKLSRTSRCELPAGPEQPMRCAYLVDRELVEDFTTSLRRLDQQLRDLELVCTGPWPPYSFAEAVLP